MTEDLRELAREAIETSHATEDPDYPVFHLAPPVGRLNDPNGLLVLGSTHHAFYQFSPFHPQRRLVYWGHASSEDLLHWEQHEPAIVPDSSYDRNGAYSGTAVHEGGNTLLYYTGNVKDPETGMREATQCLVTSPDLVTFTKHPDNPLIRHQPAGYTAHFRDPQVWRDADGSHRMLLGAQREDLSGVALLYRSWDRLAWDFEGELTFPDAEGSFDRLGFMWECPNIFPLTDEITGEVHHVLLFCPQGAAPDQEGFENVFPCVYVVGRLEGTEMRGPTGTLTELDRGFEFYAPQVFARGPHGGDSPTLLMGWAGNAGEDDQPSMATGGWVHCMTVPRALSLRGGRLVQRPVPRCCPPPPSPSSPVVAPPTLPTPGTGTGPGTGEQSGTRSETAGNRAEHEDTGSRSLAFAGATVADDGLRVSELEGSRSFHLVLEVESSRCSSWTLRLGSRDCHVDITLEPGRLVLDRTTSRYPHGGRRCITVSGEVGARVELIHDRSVTEVFLGDGDLAATLRSFVDPAAGGVSLLVAGELVVTRAWASRRD